MRDWPVGGAVRTHITFTGKFAVLHGCGLSCPQTITVTIVTSKITDHLDEYNNNERL